MTSTFGSLNIALRGLQAMQRAIEISGHNMANAATPGYSRQKARLVAADPYSVPAVNSHVSLGQVGTGVSVNMIQRFRSGFLDGQIRYETWMLKGWETRRDVLNQIEVALNEPSDTGLNSGLSAFWAAWHRLATTPESVSARTHVAETAAGLSASLRETHRQLTELQTELDNRVAAQVGQVNDLAHRVAGLNKTIRDVEAMGQQANDLRDQRGQLLQELASLVNIDAHESESGTVMVGLGGKLLVMDHVVSEMAVEQDPANGMQNRIVWAKTGAVVQVQGIALAGGLPPLAAERLAGELGGTLIARDLILPDKLAQLDSLAGALINNVNGLHQTGFGLGGAAGGDFLAGTGARDIDLSDYIKADPTRIVSAAAAGSPGDGSVALAIGRLESAPLINGTTTAGDFYRVAVARLGQEAQQAEIMARNQNLLVQHLETRQSEIAGVSLDEETVNLVEYQRTYQAAARVMTTMDEMLDKVINGMGLVGR